MIPPFTKYSSDINTHNDCNVKINLNQKKDSNIIFGNSSYELFDININTFNNDEDIICAPTSVNTAYEEYFNKFTLETTMTSMNIQRKALIVIEGVIF